VIGRDVNLAARVASLCGQLNEPLLFSNAFKNRLTEAEIRELGAFKLKGVQLEERVFAPFAGAKGEPV
jgi:adenylate cyclase